MNWQPRAPKYQGIVRTPVSRQASTGMRAAETGMRPAPAAPNGGAVMSPPPVQKATSPQLGNPAMPKATPQPQPQAVMMAAPQTKGAPGAFPDGVVKSPAVPNGFRQIGTGGSGYDLVKYQQWAQQMGYDWQDPNNEAEYLKSLGVNTDGTPPPVIQRPPAAMAEKGPPPQSLLRYNEHDAANMMQRKAAAGTLTAADALYARQNGNEALATAILRAVAGLGWNYTPAQPMQTELPGAIDPNSGLPAGASVYNRPQMAPPPQFVADVDPAAMQPKPYQVRVGGVSRAGKGIYTG